MMTELLSVPSKVDSKRQMILYTLDRYKNGYRGGLQDTPHELIPSDVTN